MVKECYDIQSSMSLYDVKKLVESLEDVVSSILSSHPSYLYINRQSQNRE